MLFKEQGGKVQVLLYAGYDEATNIPRIKKVGSFDKYTYKPSPGLMDKLNAAQRDELQAEFERRRQLALGLNRQHYLKSIVPTLEGACESLRNGVRLDTTEASRVWDALDDMGKALRQAGHPRTGKGRTSLPDPHQPPLLADE